MNTSAKLQTLLKAAKAVSASFRHWFSSWGTSHNWVFGAGVAMALLFFAYRADRGSELIVDLLKQQTTYEQQQLTTQRGIQEKMNNSAPKNVPEQTADVCCDVIYFLLNEIKPKNKPRNQAEAELLSSDERHLKTAQFCCVGWGW